MQTIEVFRVENITPEVFTAIRDLLPLWHSECGFANYSEDKADDTIDLCLRDGAVIVAREGDVIVGAMGLAVAQFWYSEEYLVQEFFTIVHPDHRKSQHAKHLLREAKKAARKLHLPLLACVNSTVRTEGKCRLYRRHLTPIGQLFMDTQTDE